MDTATYNLTVQRLCYFDDDVIIALSTNITWTTSSATRTTLTSRLLLTGQITVGFFNLIVRPLSDGNYSLFYIQNKTSNVQWIHVGGSNIGYLLQLQQAYASVEVRVGMKTTNSVNIGHANITVTE